MTNGIEIYQSDCGQKQLDIRLGLGDSLAAIAELKKTLIATGEELMIRLVEHFILLKASS
ncbi:MAG: hypothetical protein ACK4SX_08090 [Alcanivoracaceae bacterium]